MTWLYFLFLLGFTSFTSFGFCVGFLYSSFIGFFLFSKFLSFFFSVPDDWVLSYYFNRKIFFSWWYCGQRNYSVQTFIFIFINSAFIFVSKKRIIRNSKSENDPILSQCFCLFLFLSEFFFELQIAAACSKWSSHQAVKDAVLQQIPSPIINRPEP